MIIHYPEMVDSGRRLSLEIADVRHAGPLTLRVRQFTFGTTFLPMGSRGAACEVTSAIDIALWDIRGKQLGLPVYELLGGAVRSEISLYTHPDQSKFTSRQGVIDEIRAIVDSGHTSLKFDPFPHQGDRERRDGYLDGELTRKDEREAAELTALIRETAGPDVDVLIDAHGRFDVPTAIRLCRSLEEAGQIDWFEEPCPPESLNALKQVREKVSAPISWASAGTPNGTSCRCSKAG